MVMSVPAREARATCIRCGMSEFHILEQTSGQRQRSPVVSEPTLRITWRDLPSRRDIRLAGPVAKVTGA
jgi:hypothetical protein